MPRLFVAIDLPELQRRELRSICHDLPEETRWTPAEQLHLTLRFIGEVEGHLFLRIKKELAGLVFAPFLLQIQGLGSFPAGRHARILWAGVEQCPELEQLQALIEGCLGQIGFQPETRKFHPHITIARLPPRISPEVLEAYIARNQQGALPPFPVECFHLYSSRLSRAGAVHFLEGSYGAGVHPC